MEEEKEVGKTDKIVVSFNDEVTEYERVIISGKEINEKDTNTTFMYGYSDFEKFVNDYTNILITTTQFLTSESDLERERVVNIVKDLTLQTFDAILNGDFDKTLNDIENLE